MGARHRVALRGRHGPEWCLFHRGRGRHEQTEEWSDDPPGHDPDRWAHQEGDDDRDAGPHDRGHQLAATGDESDRESDHRRREDDVDPQASRVRDLGTEQDPGQGGQVPGHEDRPDRGHPVAAFIRATESPEVADRQRERLVGQDVGHHRPAPGGNVAKPRRQRRRVEQMPGVEQRREDEDPGPGKTTRHVADRRELRRPGEHDRAHRHGLDDRETGRTGGQAVDEPEADRGDRDPDPVGDESAPTGSKRWIDRRGQRRKVLPQVPSQTTNSACFSAA